MNTSSIRILFLADTHLGFDLPFRPRVERRRRGHDFFANYQRALEPAFRGEVDFIIHGGDLFYRSRVRAALVDMALAPLVEAAEKGVPVFIVPGNHERSRIPGHLWTAHSNIHIFHEPRTFLWQGRGIRVALAGFPFQRRIRDAFPYLVENTGYREIPADFKLLCLHQAIEGARVGPTDFTFRRGADVVRSRDIAREFDVILSGHIHRGQLLTQDLKGRTLAAPVVYPGSIERTSFAERFEEKCYVKLNLKRFEDELTLDMKIDFVRLPARPMVKVGIKGWGLGIGDMVSRLRSELDVLEPDSVVRIDLEGPLEIEVEKKLSAALVRSLAPETMNVSLFMETS